MKPVINTFTPKPCATASFKFLLDIQAEYGDVVYHNNVRWLSRGYVLQRFYCLRKEIGQFLEKKGQLMPELSDPVWLADFGFLVDMIRHLNALNTSLQGQNAVISQLYSNIKTFGIKLQLFQRHLLQTQPNELQCDAECRSQYQQLLLVDFYRRLDKGRFQEIRTFAKTMLSLFGSTYLCEKTFSVMNFNKNRVRTRLSDSHLRDILHIKTTFFEPDLSYLLQSRSQYHPSH
ncbi:general transcription factor II-I repeat domain-containing protein 2 [Tachysurus ichikawai]